MMPVEQCQIDGKQGWRWGKSGKCYTGKGAKAKARLQGIAVEASKKQKLEFASQALNKVDTALTLERAREFWRKKTNITTEKWNSLQAAEHARAFTTAGLMQADFLEDMRKAMDQVVIDGGDLQTFRDDFRDIVDRSGWNYYGSEDWRTSLIYRQNMNTAWNAGRFVVAMEQRKEKPYMKRILGDSKEHRKSHAKEANRGVVYPVEARYWDINMPPYWKGKTEFNCACKVITLSGRVVKTGGFRIEDPKITGKIVNPGRIEWTESYKNKINKKINAYPTDMRKSVSKWFGEASKNLFNKMTGWLVS